MSTPATVVEDLDGTPDRIRASAERLRDLEASADLERATRNRLIVEACDRGGVSQERAAHYAGLSQPQVLRILAKASTA